MRLYQWTKWINVAWLCYPHWFCLNAQRCSSCWGHYHPSNSCIITSEADSVFCPPVLMPGRSEVCVNVTTASSQYSAEENVDSMLITFFPWTERVSSCQLGATLGQNPFECLNVNISSPFFPLRWVCVCVCVCVCVRVCMCVLWVSHLFSLFVCSGEKWWQTHELQCF